MVDLPNNSFIPKRGPSKRSTGNGAKQVYVFTLISYVSIFATLIGSGGVFLFGKHIDNNFEKEVIALNEIRKNFDDADLQRVQEFDIRLGQAYGRLNSSASVVAVFDAIEKATIDRVQIESLELNRIGDDKYVLATSIITDTFDSTLFQREVFEDSESVTTVAINDFKAAGSESETEDDLVSVFSFTAEIEIPLGNVPYLVEGQSGVGITKSEPASDSTESGGVEVTSDENNTEDNQTEI